MLDYINLKKSFLDAEVLEKKMNAFKQSYRPYEDLQHIKLGVLYLKGLQ